MPEKMTGGIALLALFLFLGTPLPFSLLASENPGDRIDFWQSHYRELKPEDESRAASAHRIFNRVLNVAGKRPGSSPRLLIIDAGIEPVSPASALPDGGIVITTKVFDICYRDPVRGDDRLAFILGHEIAHQLKNDFWHMRFFQAISISRQKDPGSAELLKEVRSIAKDTDKLFAKELQADEHGILYASMAGFDTASIVSENGKVNFFEEYYRAIDPENLLGAQRNPSHPTTLHRAEVVKARLRQVLEWVDLFRLGLYFYEAEQYERAAHAFEEFLRFFPAREVYHDLAACHHQLAVKHYNKWIGGKDPLPFLLSISVDPETRAGRITLRGKDAKNAETLFRFHLDRAIGSYENALSLDPSYALSYNNLGCALLLKGEPYKAVAMFKDALKIDGTFKEVHNNLGVAFHLAENPARAQESFALATELDPAFPAPRFNLGKIAFEEKRREEAKRHWEEYLKLEDGSSRAAAVRTALGLPAAGSPEKSFKGGSEAILGVDIGAPRKQIPPEFGPVTKVRRISLGKEPMTVEAHDCGVVTISHQGKIVLIFAQPGFTGKSEKGIGVGARSAELKRGYGLPGNVLALVGGEAWVYRERGISFRVQDGKVASWELF